MLLPSDNLYKLTKQIMLGKAAMNPEFRQLANFIDQRFGVKTINIEYDNSDKNIRPLLEICFEFKTEKQLFNKDGGYFNFDPIKQNLIADQFYETNHNSEVSWTKGIYNIFKQMFHQKNQAKDIWVNFSAFEPIAKLEAMESVTQDQITRLKDELNEETIWEISNYGGTAPIFFLYSEQQKKDYENSETAKIWADQYFDLLEPYNEFGYYNRENFHILLDSKENFDNNYSSNWYYYYK